MAMQKIRRLSGDGNHVVASKIEEIEPTKAEQIQASSSLSST